MHQAKCWKIALKCVSNHLKYLYKEFIKPCMLVQHPQGYLRIFKAKNPMKIHAGVSISTAVSFCISQSFYYWYYILGDLVIITLLTTTSYVNAIHVKWNMWNTLKDHAFRAKVLDFTVTKDHLSSLWDHVVIGIVLRTAFLRIA